MTTRPQKHLSLILLFVIMTFTNAQHQSTSSPQPQPFQGPSGNITPSMVIIMVVILVAFSSTAIFSIFLSSCAQVSYAHETAPSSDKSLHRGLDPAVIASFPVFVYADVKELKIGKGALECAVCLSEFEDDDTLRLIPKCTHVFHPECIDAWLASHVTCPVCRATLPSHDETKEIYIELQSISIRDADSDNVILSEPALS